MNTWPKDELRKIAEADDLHIGPFREDGKTYGTPTWIWSVAVDDALYVRAYNWQNSRWYQAALRWKAGRIIAAGVTKEVTFEPVEGPINDRIDEAYRAKYGDSLYLAPMIVARSRTATVKVMPREVEEDAWSALKKERTMAVAAGLDVVLCAGWPPSNDGRVLLISKKL
jgi:hypothetical protein